MTDKEVIRALGCCVNGKCFKCPLKTMNCSAKVPMAFALDLISRQQVEIERLQSMNQAKLDTIHDIQADNERLEKAVDNYEACLESVEKIKSKAIKKFADEIDYEILHKEFWNDHPHTSQVWLNGYEQCMRDMRVMLKDKSKEMEGEDK